MSVGEKIKKARETKGYSKYRVSKLTNISLYHIGCIERGVRQPTFETIERILSSMGITASELFSEDGNTFNLSDDEMQLVMNFRTMTAEKAKSLLEMSHILNYY